MRYGCLLYGIFATMISMVLNHSHRSHLQFYNENGRRGGHSQQPWEEGKKRGGGGGGGGRERLLVIYCFIALPFSATFPVDQQA